MNVVDRITAVLVDTSAFREANSDFLGIASALLPSFFDVIKEKEIVLLTHPILDKEIEKHVEESSLYKNFQALKGDLNKCKSVLAIAGCRDDAVMERIDKYDVKAAIFDAYQDRYSEAVRLKYVNPESIFDRYFNATPPFAAAGKKKSEFPDAFVIEAAKQYVDDHPNDVLLVVSKDADWKISFAESCDAVMCGSIADALTMINNIESVVSAEMLNEVFRGAYSDMLREVQFYVENEAYELDEYELVDDLEIDSIDVESIDDTFDVLRVKRNYILINTVAHLKITGHAEVVDEDRSFWDNEDKAYIFKEYVDVELDKADAEVACEIKISFDFDSPADSADVVSCKLIDSGNIVIHCKNAVTTHISEDEMALRCLREDKGLSRRRS